MAGSFVREGRTIAFDIARDGESSASTFRTVDGELLLRATFTKGAEKLELAGGVTLEGAPGSLFRNSEPQWSELKVGGDVSTLSALLARPDFGLIGDLARELSQHDDIDLSAFPSVADLKLPSTPPSDVAGVTSSAPMSHDPTACGFCHAGCAAAAVACVAATWGVFAWLCIAPGIACHAACASGPCQ